MNKLLGERSAKATKRAGPTAQTDYRAKRGRSANHNGGESEASSEGSGTALWVQDVEYVPAKTVVMGRQLCHKFRRALEAKHSQHWESHKREKSPNDNLLDGNERYEWEYVRTEGAPEGFVFPGQKHLLPVEDENKFFMEVAHSLLERKVSVNIPAFKPVLYYGALDTYKEEYVGRSIQLAVEPVPKGDPVYPYKGLFNRSGCPIAKGKPVGIYAGLLMETKAFDAAYDKHPAGHMNDLYAWDFHDVTDFMAEKGVPNARCGPQLIVDAYMYRNDLAFANDCRIIPVGETGGKRKTNTAALNILLDGMPLTVFWTLKKINEGDQLLLDYGQEYWNSKAVNEKKETERLKHKAELHEKEKAAQNLTEKIKRLEREAEERDVVTGGQTKMILETNRALKAERIKLQQAKHAQQMAIERDKQREEEGRRQKEQQRRAEIEKRIIQAQKDFADKERELQKTRDGLGGCHDTRVQVKCAYCASFMPAESIAKHYGEQKCSTMVRKPEPGKSPFRGQVCTSTDSNHKNYGKFFEECPFAHYIHPVPNHVEQERCARCSEALGFEVYHTPMWRHLIHGCQQHMGSSCIDMHDIGYFTVDQARTLLEQMGTLDSESQMQLEIATKFIAKEEGDRQRRMQLIGEDKDERRVFAKEKEMEEDSFDIWNKSTRAGPDPHANNKRSVHNQLVYTAAALQVQAAEQGNATAQLGRCWNCKVLFDRGHLELTRESPKEGMQRCAEWSKGCGAWYCTKDCLKEHARGRGKGRCDKEPHTLKCPVKVDDSHVVASAGAADAATASSGNLQGFPHPFGGSGGSYNTNVNYGSGGGSSSSHYSYGSGRNGSGGGGASYNTNSNYGGGSSSDSSRYSHGYGHGSGSGGGGAGYNRNSSYHGGGIGGSDGYGADGGVGYSCNSGYGSSSGGNCGRGGGYSYIGGDQVGGRGGSGGSGHYDGGSGGFDSVQDGGGWGSGVESGRFMGNQAPPPMQTVQHPACQYQQPAPPQYPQQYMQQVHSQRNHPDQRQT